MGLDIIIGQRVVPKEHEYVEKSKTVCVTGPRPDKLLGYVSIEAYIPLIRTIRENIVWAYEEGFRRFICGGAQGIDQLFYKAVVLTCERYNLSDVVKSVYVPFYGQEDRWSEEGTFGKQDYYNMVYSADEVKVISPDVKSGCAYGVMCEAYDLHNKAMLNSSGLLMAWDLGHKTGGTANCMRDAIKLGIPIRYINKGQYYEKD